MTSSVPRSLSQLMLPALLGLILVITGAGPVQAHAALLSSDPADGASLAKAPQQVTFTFSDPVLDTGATLTATQDSVTQPLPTKVQGAKLVGTWPQEWDGGDFTIGYRAVADDGHVMSGSINFTVTGGAKDTGQTKDSSRAEDAAPSTSAAPGTSTAAPATTGDSTSDDATAPGQIPPWIWLLVAIAGIAGLVWWLRTRNTGETK